MTKMVGMESTDILETMHGAQELPRPGVDRAVIDIQFRLGETALKSGSTSSGSVWAAKKQASYELVAHYLIHCPSPSISDREWAERMAEHDIIAALLAASAILTTDTDDL